LIPFSTTPVNLAVPPLRLTAEPLLRLVIVVPAVSVNVTEPVAVVDVWVVSDTVAVMVAGWPLTNAVGLMVTEVVVLSPGLVPVPLAETCCVLPATLSVLLVTAYPRIYRNSHQRNQPTSGSPHSCTITTGIDLILVSDCRPHQPISTRTTVETAQLTQKSEIARRPPGEVKWVRRCG
jgi:hypothetical protein